jgi:transcriptional regulator GlxA family with amidase domain
MAEKEKEEVPAMSALRAVSRVLAHIGLRPFVYLAAILLVPLVVGGISVGAKFSSVDQGPAVAPVSLTLPSPPPYDPAKKTAVFLVSNYGAEVTDLLPNYEILARSGLFNLYVVAPEHKLLSFGDSFAANAGLDFLPHFSFAEYQAAIGRAPDLIAVPYLPGYTPSRDAAVLDWLRAEAGPQTVVLGICAGTAVVADSGLVNGHYATTNTGWFDRLEKSAPAVRWIRNVRYVDDGPVVMSANLGAGMDATLHVVDRFGGRAVAEEVARQIGYPTTRYLDDPSWQFPAGANTPSLPVMLNTAYRLRTEDLGVVLYDGVGELSLASVVDPYTLLLTTHLHTLGLQRAPIRSQHGLYFVPRFDFATAPHLDRILVPSVKDGEWAYAASLKDIARTQGDAIAAGAGSILFLHPGPGLGAGAGFAITPLIVASALSLLGAGSVYVLDRLRRRLSATKALRVGRVARFVLHFVEMAVAMALGMVAMGALNALALEPNGFLYLTPAHLETHLLAMGFFMAAPMVAWMRLRGHGWRHGAEMAAAMVVPAAAAIALNAAGLLARADMMAFSNTWMWVAMVGVMLVRWPHYSGAPQAHRAPAPAPATLAPAR